MFSFLVATLSSSNFRHHCRNGTPTVSTSWIHFQFHLGFLHFCQWWRKAHSPLTNMAFFSYCSGLLRCIQQGSHQSTTIFTTSGNACACVSFRKHGSASGWVYGLVQIEERNRKKKKKKKSFYSGNFQNTEISVRTFQFYESPYKYGCTFTHANGIKISSY